MTDPEVVVANAGPLITLAKIGRFDLLQELFGRVTIPQAVYDEVVLHGGGQPGARETEVAGWISIQPAGDRLAVAFLGEELGPGESEAIVLAQELSASGSCWMMHWRPQGRTHWPPGHRHSGCVGHCKTRRHDPRCEGGLGRVAPNGLPCQRASLCGDTGESQRRLNRLQLSSRMYSALVHCSATCPWPSASTRWRTPLASRT